MNDVLLAFKYPIVCPRPVYDFGSGSIGGGGGGGRIIYYTVADYIPPPIPEREAVQDHPCRIPHFVREHNNTTSSPEPILHYLSHTHTHTQTHSYIYGPKPISYMYVYTRIVTHTRKR